LERADRQQSLARTVLRGCNMVPKPSKKKNFYVFNDASIPLASA
jgi:hypothetical protein